MIALWQPPHDFEMMETSQGSRNCYARMDQTIMQITPSPSKGRRTTKMRHINCQMVDSTYPRTQVEVEVTAVTIQPSGDVSSGLYILLKHI